MAKIDYPEETGIVPVIEAPVNDAIKQLDKASNECSFSVPSTFDYINYLRSLPTLISNYKKDANEIITIAKNIDNNFKAAFEEIESSLATLNTDILETRDRLVK